VVQYSGRALLDKILRLREERRDYKNEKL